MRPPSSSRSGSLPAHVDRACSCERVRWLLRCSLLLALLSPLSAAAEDGDEPVVYARVTVATAAIRAGPSATYRQVYLARRDEVFPLRGRAASGYWFRVELP